MPDKTSNDLRTAEDYWRIALARRWWILGPTFLCWIAVWTASWILPASYRSETLILVEHQKIPQEYVVPNVAIDLQGRLQSMTQQILSRTRLLRIIDQFNLYEKDRKNSDPDLLVNRMRKDIQIELVESKDNREVNAFKVSYLASSPQLAQQVAGQLTSLFIEENLRAQQEQSESTTEFLSSQLEELRGNLTEQEAKIKDFKIRYLGELPSQMQSNVQILTGLQNRQQMASEALARAQQEKLYLESLLHQYQSLQISSGKGGEAGSPSALDQELTRLKNDLADAEARYTPNHPDVVRLRAQVLKTQKLRDQIMRDIAKAQKSPTSDKGDPATLTDLQAMAPTMQLESQLKSNELQIQNAQKELRDVQQQINDYQARLHLAPMREQQLADLTRNYEQSRANYDSLLKKQLQSQLATNLEKEQQGQQFRVIDPPNLPQKAFLPNRQKFSLIGLAAGLALGLVVTIGIETIDARIRSERELKTLFNLRVLAGVPRLVSAQGQQKLARRTIAEACAAGILIALIITGNLVTFFKG